MGKNKKKTGISYIIVTFWDRVIGFTDEPVVRCDVPPAKNIYLDDDNNDDYKYILIGILNVLFLELILCMVLVA